MSEQERVAVADAADMIVNNYAFTKDGTNVRVLNLRTGSASVILPDGRVPETSMEDIELDVVLAYLQKTKSTLSTSGGIFHDRYIIIDFGTGDEKIYHFGASSKDGGNRVVTIEQVSDRAIYRPLVEKLLLNPNLVLK